MTETATILVADDDEAIRTVLRQALVRAGHEVKTTDTAAGLWKWVEDGIGDVVINDVVMHDENGLDLLPRIHARRADLPVIVMSAQNTLMNTPENAAARYCSPSAKRMRKRDTQALKVCRMFTSPPMPGRGGCTSRRSSRRCSPS